MQIRVASDARIFGKRHEQISGAGVLRLCGAVLSPSGSFVAPTQMLMVMVLPQSQFYLATYLQSRRIISAKLLGAQSTRSLAVTAVPLS